MTRGRGSGMLRFASAEELKMDPASRRERYNSGAMHLAERELLASGLDLCQKHPAVAWAKRSNVGAGYLLRPNTYDRLVKAGHLDPKECRFHRFGLKDAGDIVGMFKGSGKHFEVETKSDRGIVSEGQQVHGDAVNGGGGLWIVARSLDDILKGIGQ